MLGSKKIRTPSAACPACKSPDLLVERLVMRSAVDGLYQTGGLCSCVLCLTKFVVIEGKVIVPSWIAERNAKQSEAESLTSLREKFRKESAPPALVERDLKWTG